MSSRSGMLSPLRRLLQRLRYATTTRVQKAWILFCHTDAKCVLLSVLIWIVFVASIPGMTYGMAASYTARRSEPSGKEWLALPAECKRAPSLDGHPAIETHEIVTADGVIIEMWRIPSVQPEATKVEGARDSSPAGTPTSFGVIAQPVLLVSGMESSSQDWFATLGRDALPWMLWRAGYDVWLGANRGTFLAHTQRWNWTFVEMADFDFPAMIEGVLAATLAPSLAHVCHSQSCLQAFMHLSSAVGRRDVLRVAHIIALAPAVFITQQRFTWKMLSFAGLDKWTPLVLSGKSFILWEDLARARCSHFCDSCMNDMGGGFSETSNGSHDACMEKFRCIPAGTSTDNVIAFAESSRLGSFQAYLEHRGRPINFSALHSVAATLVAGGADLFMQPADIRRIGDMWGVSREGCARVVPEIWEIQGFGHMDLVWGSDAPKKLYTPVVARLLERFPPLTL